MKQPTAHQAVHGWIFYDDSCGFCRRWISFWESALQADWAPVKLQLSEAELLHDLRLLLANGSQIRGADVYRYATGRIWWAWPEYLFSITPGLRNIFDWGYRTFAANRFRVSSACCLDTKN